MHVRKHVNVRFCMHSKSYNQSNPVNDVKQSFTKWYRREFSFQFLVCPTTSYYQVQFTLGKALLTSGSKWRRLVLTGLQPNRLPVVFIWMAHLRTAPNEENSWQKGRVQLFPVISRIRLHGYIESSIMMLMIVK